jgi:hypothetical protein
VRNFKRAVWAGNVACTEAGVPSPALQNRQTNKNAMKELDFELSNIETRQLFLS